MANWKTPDTLLLLQSRLYSPSYAGPARWVILNSRTRRAFSAIGPDVVPDVIPVLAMASRNGGSSDEELLSINSRISSKHLQSLIQADMLVPATNPATEIPDNFTSCYQTASQDYPFHEYGLPDWQENEERILKQYDRLWPPPPAIEARQGTAYNLPEVTTSDLLPGDRSGTLTLRSLAAILRYTFGPIGQVYTSRVMCMRRTSPSGGARHPTEVVVVLSQPIESIPRGSYVYDEGRHALVLLPEGGHTWKINQPHGVAFVLRSRVERAMWRYREIRAWRPVLLDAGHIIETLSLLLHKAGIDSYFTVSPITDNGQFDWLDEPALGVVVAGAPRQKFERTPSNGSLNGFEQQDESLTSPGFYMKFKDGGLEGHTLWPVCATFPLDFNDFRILNHCLPSNRGDRITTRVGILDVVKEASQSQVERLRLARALLPRNVADRFYRAARLWVRYSWYLSLLQHLETLADQGRAQSSISARDYLKEITTLLVRKTVRKFSGQPMLLSSLEELLCRSLECSDVEMGPAFRVFVAALAVDGLEVGLYEWHSSSRSLERISAVVSRELIRKLTAGQPPASSGAVTVWLVRRLDLRSPGTYQMHIMEMGRLGQRLCLVAAELGFGVFLTPAISDSEVCSLVENGDPLPTVSYLFSIGKENG